MDSRHQPERQCIGCRAVRPKEDLLRFVKTGAPHAVFDRDCRLGGRGFYLCPDEKCFREAHRNKKTRAAYFRKQDSFEDMIREVRETILKSIEKDLILSKEMGYLLDARSEEISLGEDGALVVSCTPPDGNGEMHTTARPLKARRFLLPAAACGSLVQSYIVSGRFPMLKRLTMNLQKYEMLSSKGPAL
ncbi:MAG TPA: YlxR family protein [Deltaproteobacteria bacterium]|nr:YlxR family protein [Deltaproteobacteria bacterium]HOI06385.1 YlxR family protein [Deltaproteobacteria bacterium]